jgi:Family of unknown function (DUF6444)
MRNRHRMRCWPLVAPLRRELADALGALDETWAELAGARERIAYLQARVRQTPRNSSRPPSGERLDKPPPRRSPPPWSPRWPTARSAISQIRVTACEQ